MRDRHPILSLLFNVRPRKGNWGRAPDDDQCDSRAVLAGRLCLWSFPHKPSRPPR